MMCIIHTISNSDVDFDSLYVLPVKWQDGKPFSVSFEKDAEGLNRQSAECPGTRP